MASTTTDPISTPAIATARGKIARGSGDLVTFSPSNTTYILHLTAPGYDGPVDRMVGGVIRVKARKAYTVPSGGNFISPIIGPPRTIQGRVQSVQGNSIVLLAGTAIRVELPGEASAVEMASGSITVGSLVNVVAFPGATFEPTK